MAATIITDTHRFVIELTEAGMEQKQAEALARQFSSNMAELATKKDLDRAVERLENRLTLRIGGMLVIAVTVVTALNKLMA